jgi:hypothetical protein
LVLRALRKIRKLRSDEKAMEGRGGGRSATVHKKVEKSGDKARKIAHKPRKK